MATVTLPPAPPPPHASVREERRRHLLRLLEGRPPPSLLRCIHALALRLGILSKPDASAGLLTAACRSDHLVYALKVFDRVPNPNLYSWNILIQACASSPGSGPALALRLLSLFLHEGRLSPDSYTYTAAFKATSALHDARLGRALHAMVAKSSPSLRADVFVSNSILNMYASCGDLDSTHGLFARMPHKDLVSWNSLIHALVDAGRCAEAVKAFRSMEEERFKPDKVTVVGLLAACGKLRDLDRGREFHRYLESRGIGQDLVLHNALLDMYFKCGSLKDALKVFDEMPERDVFSWTTMVAGNGRFRKYHAARKALRRVSAPGGIAPWNALISAYEKSGRPREALDAFSECLRNVDADGMTLSSALSACGRLGSLNLGSWIHAYMKERGIKMDAHLATSLITMYSKCGDLAKALEVFGSTNQRNVFVWSAVIMALAMHGKATAAMDFFERMVGDGVAPNKVTFRNVLWACSRGGLVEEGRRHFERMRGVFGIEPESEHYRLMVEILSEAGLDEEAEELKAKMPVPPRKRRLRRKQR